MNSIPEKCCTRIEFGPDTPNRRAPLASGGNTNGMIIITLRINLPLNPVYLARRYARGTPNRIRSSVEIVAEVRLRRKASQRSCLVNDSSMVLGSVYARIVARG